MIAPWRLPEFIQKFQGRQDLLRYASENNIPVSVTPSAPWSMDANLMHISYKSGILENPNNQPPQNLYNMTKDPQTTNEPPYKLEIHFKNGIPSLVKSDDAVVDNPLDILVYLNDIGGKHGVGRIDIVENRFIGLKV